MTRYYTFFSSTYGSGAYSACTYDNTTSCTATSSSAGSGSLANTGVAIVGVVSFACLLIAVALAVKFWHRSHPKQPILQESDVTDDDAQSSDDTSTLGDSSNQQ